MQTRNANGATLAMVAVSAVVIILVGVGIFFLMQIFGGFRELQHATDAGNLNVAKRALKEPSFVIANEYQMDFSGLIDGSNGMDLLVYNRCVGQAFLVAMNAMADRPQGNLGGSPALAGLQNARMLSQIANGGDPASATNVGIGQQLYQEFSVHSTGNKLFKRFNDVAQGNAARMLGDKDGNQINQKAAEYDIAFMEPNGPTNVFVNPALLPYVGDSSGRISTPDGSLATLKNKDGFNYLAGYNKIAMGSGGVTWNLIGVPVFPQSQPHHVASRDFMDAKSRFDSVFQGLVPPNAFKSATDAANQTSGNMAQMEAYGIVGVMNQEYPISIPKGYIEVVNPRGYDPGYGSANPDDWSVFARELGNGIKLGKTSAGDVIAFSSNRDVIQAWADYNADPTSYPKPPANDPANGPVFFAHPDGTLADGDFTSSITRGDAGGPCYWSNSSPDAPDNPCKNMSNAFDSVYSKDEPAHPAGTHQLTAVEKLKFEVIKQFNRCGEVNCPAPIVGADGTPQEGTGLRHWESVAGHGRSVTHGAASPISPGQEPIISTPGTIHQLIQQVAADQEDAILRQVAQRMHEIHPETSEDEAKGWLMSNPTALELGTRYYIYYDGGWQMKNANDGAPDGRHRALYPDGTSHYPTSDGSLQRYASDAANGYQTINTMVNPPHENGIHLQYFTRMPDASTTSRGVDVVDWQPSSGYGNLLGVLTFRNFCSGSVAGGGAAGGTYCAPD